MTTGRHIVYSPAPQGTLWQGLCGHATNRIFMDDELERIREKKRREMAEHLQGTGEKGTKNPVVHPVNQANFRQMLTAHPFLVIDFWAEWCGPCRMVGPVIEDLSREYAGSVTFAKCNTDENPGIAGGFGISAIPTIILFRDGSVADIVVGAYPKEALKARIQKAFSLATDLFYCIAAIHPIISPGAVSLGDGETHAPDCGAFRGQRDRVRDPDA